MPPQLLLLLAAAAVVVAQQSPRATTPTWAVTTLQLWRTVWRRCV